MLRRRRDGRYEFLHVERVLGAAAPPALAPDRKEALRVRIMAQLGEQDPAPRRFPALRERWVAIPAGIGVAAAILAANHFLLASPGGDFSTHARASNDVLVNGRISTRVAPGDDVRAITASWIGVGDDVTLGLEAGTSLRYFEETSGLRVELTGGRLAVAARRPNTVVVGGSFNALLPEGGTVHVDDAEGGTWLTAAEGTVEVRTPTGLQVLRGGERLFIPADPGGAAPPPAGPVDPAAGGGGSAPPGPQGGGAPPPSDSTPKPDPSPGAGGGDTTPGTPSATPEMPAPPGNGGDWPGGGNATPPAGGNRPPTGTPGRLGGATRPTLPAWGMPTPPSRTATPPVAGSGSSNTLEPREGEDATPTPTPGDSDTTPTPTASKTEAAPASPTPGKTGPPSPEPGTGDDPSSSPAA